MAMPASGSIAIISAPQACGSICAAVGCASGSLTTLSVAAGKSAPHCMREFYGYASSVDIDYNGGTYICSISTCMDKYWTVAMTNRVSPNVMTLCFSYEQTMGKLTNVCYLTSENGGGWVTRAGPISVTGSGSFAITGIDYNDSLCARISMSGDGTIAEGILCLQNPPAVFTTGSGTITRGSPYTCVLTLGM